MKVAKQRENAVAPIQTDFRTVRKKEVTVVADNRCLMLICLLAAVILPFSSFVINQKINYL